MSNSENKKLKIRAVLDLEFDPNEEHPYEVITRVEHALHRQILLGMFGADHSCDAALTDSKVSLEEVGPDQ